MTEIIGVFCFFPPHHSELTPFHNFIVYYRDTDTTVILFHYLYLMLEADKGVLVVLFLTGANTSHSFSYFCMLVTTFDLVPLQAFCTSYNAEKQTQSHV